MKFELEVICENAAFEENRNLELARILRDVAGHLERAAQHPHANICPDGAPIFDANGNNVGGWAVEPEGLEDAE